MSCTPTKTMNPSWEWTRMSEKINVLKTSTRTNDSPPGGITFYENEIDAILDFRQHNGVEQYLVAWKSDLSDLKTTWETEQVLEALCKEALVKFWVQTALAALPSQTMSENESVKCTIAKKLKNWASSVSTYPSVKKEASLSPCMPPAKKRPRCSEPDEVETKPLSLYPVVRELYSENPSKLAPPHSCPDRLQSILEPDEYAELIEKQHYEIGELIPSSEDEGNGGTSNSYTILWFNISHETPNTLGISEDRLNSNCSAEEVIHLRRYRYGNVTSIRKIPTKKNDFTAIPKSSCDSCSESDASTQPPSSSSSESGQSDMSTRPPSSMEQVEELMDYAPLPEESSEEQADEGAQDLTDEGVQTDVLDPFTCIYCQAKRGEEYRISSLRQRSTNKKREVGEVVSAKSHAVEQVKKESLKDDDDEEEDMVPIEYEIEKILDYRIQEGTNADEYYIRWKNYTSDYDTWEPDSNLSCCDKALVSFYAKRADERRKAESELKKLGSNGALVPVGGSTNNGKKKGKIPSIPPIPEIVLKVLTRVTPISDGEVELAFKLSKTVKKKTIWTQKKLAKIMLEVIGNSASGKINMERATAHVDLPDLRHQLLMVEAERRKDLVWQDLQKWQRHLNKIAEGKPEIFVENNFDLAGPPKDFRYINDNVLGEGVIFPIDSVEGCDCTDACSKDKSQCCPGKHGKVLAYNSFKRLRVLPGYPIYECNKRCKCPPDCVNRVVQDGTTNLAGMKLCIFRTQDDRGWGVKTLKKIKKGTFVCLYAGEIITNDEADRRGKIYEEELGACYLFDLDYYESENDDLCPYTIDATKMGNISHFINHSCGPNLNVFNVWADCVDQNLPKLAFFAIKDINKDEELTYDYGSTEDEDPMKNAPPLQFFPPRENATPPPVEAKMPTVEVDEETGSDVMIDQSILFSDISPSKNRMKPATTSMSAVRRPCLCGAKNCRKVLF